MKSKYLQKVFGTKNLYWLKENVYANHFDLENDYENTLSYAFAWFLASIANKSVKREQRAIQSTRESEQKAIRSAIPNK